MTSAPPSARVGRNRRGDEAPQFDDLNTGKGTSHHDSILSGVCRQHARTRPFCWKRWVPPSRRVADQARLTPGVCLDQASIDRAVASLLDDFESWREFPLMTQPFAPQTEDDAPCRPASWVRGGGRGVFRLQDRPGRHRHGNGLAAAGVWSLAREPGAPSRPQYR